MTAVGNPTPRARWITRDRPVTFSPFYEVTDAGHLKIHSVEPSLSGNYTCSAKNLFGEDEVFYTVLALKPPNPPQLSVQFATSDSIKLKWEVPDNGGIAILGYTISYRVTGETWSRAELTPDQTGFAIGGLKCGTQYILKISAHNKVGDGQASDEVNVWTKGKAPQAPEEKDFLKVNTSCLNMLLSSWNNGGCPISHFSIEYRSLGDVRWTVVSSDISGSEGNKDSLVVCDFKSASWYQLKITAKNEAGKTSVPYNFATTTMTGGENTIDENSRFCKWKEIKMKLNSIFLYLQSQFPCRSTFRQKMKSNMRLLKGATGCFWPFLSFSLVPFVWCKLN